MTIFTGTFIPYEYNDKRDVYKYVTARCHDIKKSLRFITKDSEHLEVRCPLSGDYLEIVGTTDEIDWLDNELKIRGWYRTS